MVSSRPSTKALFCCVRSVCVLAIVLVILVNSLVVPASASEVASNDASWYNVFDYYYPSSSNVYKFSGENTLTYISYESRLVRTVDITVAAVGGSLTGAYFVNASDETQLEMVNVAPGVYRFYGDVSRSGSSLSIRFTSDGTATTYISIERFYVSAYRSSHIITTGDLYWENSYIGTTDSSAREYATFVGDAGTGAFEVAVSVPNWRYFDYVDIWLQFHGIQAFDSIVARFGTVFVPISTVQWESESGDTVHVLCRLDLTGLDRTSSADLILIADAFAWGDTDYHIMLRSVNGFVVSDLGNPILNAIKVMQSNVGSWLTTLGDNIASGLTTLGNNITSALTSVRTSIVSAVNSVQTAVSNGLATANDHLYELRQSIHTHTEELKEKLDDIISTINQDSSASDEFADDSESQASDLEDAVDQMEQVTKPPVDDIEISIDGYIDSESVTSAGELLGRFMENELILSMLMINLTVALMAFIVFGKKG